MLLLEIWKDSEIDIFLKYIFPDLNWKTPMKASKWEDKYAIMYTPDEYQWLVSWLWKEKIFSLPNDDYFYELEKSTYNPWSYILFKIAKK